jgi:hypothetical protein
MRWSVGLEAEQDAVLSREQIVELADAVAPYSGTASGIGTTRCGATLVVDADDRDAAIAQASAAFRQAVAAAGLPPAPIVRTEAVSEADAAEENG